MTFNQLQHRSPRTPQKTNTRRRDLKLAPQKKKELALKFL